MNPDSDNDAREFFARFMEDYYADCDEHLRAARRSLMDLEQQGAGGKPERALLDGLFRNFHTIKGLSGMVSLAEAEHLAHQLEALLAALRDGRLDFSAALLADIEDGVQQLEQIIGAKKSGSSTPDPSSLANKLTELISSLPRKETPTATSKSTPLNQPEAAPEPSCSCWLVTHVPSKELFERGLTVDKVRARLNELGRVLTATPRSTAQGIAFEFTVASKADPAAFEALKDEGLQCRLLQDMASPEPPAPTTSAPPPVPESTPLPPHASEQTTPHPARQSVVQSNIVRVDLSRLDDLMRLVGELLTSKARLSDQLNAAAGDISASTYGALHETSIVIDRQLRHLREAIMRVRLIPIGEAFERMQFVARDLMRETGKRVKVELRGQHTEIDKLIVERMIDPLLHIVRNAIGHGIETPEERAAAGKPAEGTLSLSASASGDVVVIEIEDDGRGIPVEKVAARAREMGLIGENTTLDHASLLDVICTAGFSTREKVDLTAGRGMGMNVVLTTVRELGGKLSLHTESGKGTRFKIELPITLLIADVFVVAVGEHTMAIPQPTVREILKAGLSSVVAVGQNELLPHRDSLLPLVRLSRLFNLPSKDSASFHVLVVGSGSLTTGLVVDRILGNREIVVRSMTDPLVRVPWIAGATELGDGRPILILDVASLVCAPHMNPPQVSIATGLSDSEDKSANLQPT